MVAFPLLHLNHCVSVNQEDVLLDRADFLVLRTQEMLLITGCFKCYFKKVDVAYCMIRYFLKLVAVHIQVSVGLYWGSIKSSLHGDIQRIIRWICNLKEAIR